VYIVQRKDSKFPVNRWILRQADRKGYEKYSQQNDFAALLLTFPWSFRPVSQVIVTVSARSVVLAIVFFKRLVTREIDICIVSQA
jgi:hypothetical protein